MIVSCETESKAFETSTKAMARLEVVVLQLCRMVCRVDVVSRQPSYLRKADFSDDMASLVLQRLAEIFCNGLKITDDMPSG